MFDGSRLLKMRTLKGWSQERLGEVIGVSRSAINKYETGVVAELKASQVELMAKALGCSASYLVCWTDDPAVTTTLSPEELHILSLYRDLNQEGQEQATNYLEILVDSGRYKKFSEPGLVEDA